MNSSLGVGKWLT